MVNEILDDGKLVNRFLWTFGHLLKGGVASCFKWILHISLKRKTHLFSIIFPKPSENPNVYFKNYSQYNAWMHGASLIYGGVGSCEF